MKSLILSVGFLFVSFCLMAQLPQNCNNKKRVLMLGDSWAQYMYDDNVHDRVFKAYGHADKEIVSETYEISLFSGDPDPQGSYYGVSGSEARQWRNEGTFAYLQNVRNALNANPDIDFVIVSIGGNDVLAGQEDCGWYKNMNSDAGLAGRACGFTDETSFFAKLESDLQYVIDEVLAVRSDIEVLISSYDYPNFNVTGSTLGINHCNQYACPKRLDLSYDVNQNGTIDGAELITDAELNQMMISVEVRRKLMADANPRIHFDNSLGLMHYFYGDGTAAEGTLPYPQAVTPYTEGGNPVTPSLRENFRAVEVLFIDVPADPIHLDADGYEYKAKNHTDNLFWENFRGVPDATFVSEGGTLDGYVDVEDNQAFTDGIRIGDEGAFCCSGGPSDEYRGILSFNTASLPDNATVTGASIYMMRSSADDNPFERNDKTPAVDIKNGFFGTTPNVEVVDGSEAADGTDIGCFIGGVEEDKWALRIDIDPSALVNFNLTGQTQFRVYIKEAEWSNEYTNFYDGSNVAGFAPAGYSPGVDQRIVAGNNEVYSEFSVKKTVDSDGIETEELFNQSKPIIKKEGYVYQRKFVGITEKKDGTQVENYRLMAALEHEGLGRLMGSKAPFLDITYDIPVPIELESFEAAQIGTSVQLDWASASERNSEGFDIEHSRDGIHWQNIAYTQAVGASADRSVYDYLHRTPVYGLNYYRLKMIDQDQTFEYAEVRTVDFKGDRKAVQVQPNPFSNALSLNFNLGQGQRTSIIMTDVIGKVVYQESVWMDQGAQHFTLDNLNKLSNGAYFIQVKTLSGIFTTKVLKQE